MTLSTPILLSALVVTAAALLALRSAALEAAKRMVRSGSTGAVRKPAN